MTPDAGILTTLLKSFGSAFTNGIGFIHGWLSLGERYQQEYVKEFCFRSNI
jgi:hypothetical protein